MLNINFNIYLTAQVFFPLSPGQVVRTADSLSGGYAIQSINFLTIQWLSENSKYINMLIKTWIVLVVNSLTIFSEMVIQWIENIFTG